MSAAALGEAVRRILPEVQLEGIGAARMRAAGFEIFEETRGWASMGPFEAVGKIPKLLAVAFRAAHRLCSRPVDLIVLVDFGAYNLRLAKLLRKRGYAGPIVYFFPPGAWLDNPGQARAVAAATEPLTPFAHQRDFYRSLGLPVAYFGHPLVSLVEPRAELPPAPPDGGTIALLPGSRRSELTRHVPVLLAACRLILTKRPRAAFVLGAADDDAERIARELAARAADVPLEIVRGARGAFDRADAALVASGTAVLEAALREVPCVSLYITSDAQAKIGRRIYRRAFITLPNILLDRALVPEFVQEDATPVRLALATLELLADPSPQLAGMREVRAILGPPDSLDRCARFVAESVRGPEPQATA
jgi:lipid-A-disaccharide synthase